MTEDLKKCSKCDIEKEITEFNLEKIHRNMEINVVIVFN